MLILLYFIVAFLVHIAYVYANSWSSSHVSRAVCLDYIRLEVLYGP